MLSKPRRYLKRIAAGVAVAVLVSCSFREWIIQVSAIRQWQSVAHAQRLAAAMTSIHDVEGLYPVSPGMSVTVASTCVLPREWRTRFERAGVDPDTVSVCDAFGHPLVLVGQSVHAPNDPSRTRQFATEMFVVAVGSDGVLEDETGTLSDEREFDESCPQCDTVVECRDDLPIRHFVAPTGVRAIEFALARGFQSSLDRSGSPLPPDKHFVRYRRQSAR